MIHLFIALISQPAFVSSSADEASFADYRRCVLEHVEGAKLTSMDEQILAAAREACVDDRTGAGLELAGADMELVVNDKKPQVDADTRMKLMELELSADAIAQLVERRTKAKN